MISLNITKVNFLPCYLYDVVCWSGGSLPQTDLDRFISVSVSLHHSSQVVVALLVHPYYDHVYCHHPLGPAPCQHAYSSCQWNILFIILSFVFILLLSSRSFPITFSQLFTQYPWPQKNHVNVRSLCMYICKSPTFFVGFVPGIIVFFDIPVSVAIRNICTYMGKMIHPIMNCILDRLGIDWKF